MFLDGRDQSITIKGAQFSLVACIRGFILFILGEKGILVQVACREMHVPYFLKVVIISWPLIPHSGFRNKIIPETRFHGILFGLFYFSTDSECKGLVLNVTALFDCTGELDSTIPGFNLSKQICYYSYFISNFLLYSSHFFSFFCRC